MARMTVLLVLAAAAGVTGCRASRSTASVRVALCQIEVGPSPEENLHRVEEALAEAAAQGTDVACFPEACVFGWVNPIAHEGATPIPGALTDRVGDMAGRHGLMVVPFGWAAPTGDWPEHGDSLRDRVSLSARRCGAPVIGVDGTGRLQAGPWKGFELGGQSVWCDATGAVRDVLPDRLPAVRVHSVPPRTSGAR